MNYISDIQVNEIFTIGHSTRKIDDFISLLKNYHINTLIDVRTVPYSRFNPQYRQVNLIRSLKDAGINYLFLGVELGGKPKNSSLYENGKPNYTAIKQTPGFAIGMEKVLKLVEQNIKVTLMCSEGDQNHCHRKHLISDELVKFGIIVLHINKSGGIEQQVKVNDCSLFID